jgi:hypothetical protein
MMAYVSETNSFEAFGGLKTAAARLMQEGGLIFFYYFNFNREYVGEKASTRPCFVVFDLVYCNGKSIIDSPLEDRYDLLCNIIVPRDSFLNILPIEKGCSNIDVMTGTSSIIIRF